MEGLKNDMFEFGIDVSSILNTGIILDNHIHRCPTSSGKKNNKNGWYIGYEDQFYGITCTFGDWVSGDKKTYISKKPYIKREVGDAGDYDQVSYEERERLKKIFDKRLKDAQKKREEEILKKNKASAKVAEDYINILKPINKRGKIPKYFLEKKITDKTLIQDDIKISKGKPVEIVIPVYNHKYKITSFQTITSNFKRFCKGGRVKGCFYIIFGSCADKVFLCEGFATGYSIRLATNCSVVVCFNSKNIMNVVKGGHFSDHNLIVCADNDHLNEGKNAGIEVAEDVKKTFGIDYIAPQGNIDGVTDFNDIHCKFGLEELKSQISMEIKKIESMDKKKREASEESKKAMEAFESFIKKDCHVEIVNKMRDYYNAMSVSSKPIFAIAVPLIIGSLILGRRVNIPSLNVFSSNYFLIVGNTGIGKDAPKSIVFDILTKAGMSGFVGGSGYTSPNTVFKALDRRPVHLVVAEEFGSTLIDSQNKNKNLKDILAVLTNIWGSLHSLVASEEYASGQVFQINNPGLTFCGITTPDALYKATTEDMIENGFLNRFIPFVCLDEQKTVSIKERIERKKIIKDGKLLREIVGYIKRLVPINLVPEFNEDGDIYYPYDDGYSNNSSLNDYCDDNESENDLESKENMVGGAKSDLKKDIDTTSLVDPKVKLPDYFLDQNSVEISKSAIDFIDNQVVESIEQEKIKAKKFKLSDMLNRRQEIILRVSLILCGLDGRKKIHRKDIEWSFEMVSGLQRIFINSIKRNVSGSDFESQKLQALKVIRDAGEKGLDKTTFGKISPFKKWRKKLRQEILEDLLETDLIKRVIDPKRKRAKIYKASV